MGVKVNTTPLEAEEQTAVVQWCELQGLKLTSVPNSTYTKSWSQKSKNHREGLRPGMPDLIILIPPAKSKDGIGRLLALELKRLKGGVVSQTQRDWIAALNGLNSVSIDSVVAHGADEAIAYVSSFLTEVSNSPF